MLDCGRRSPSPPHPARQAAGSGAGWQNFWVTASGSAGAASPLPRAPASLVLGGCIPPSRVVRIPPPGGPHPLFPAPPRLLTVLPARGRRRRRLCPPGLAGLGRLQGKGQQPWFLAGSGAASAILSLNARVMYSLSSTKPPANWTKNHYVHQHEVAIAYPCSFTSINVPFFLQHANRSWLPGPEFVTV